MKYVELLKLNNDGSQSIIVTCKLEDGVVICSGDSIFIENLKQNGILDHSKELKEKLYFKDGLRFLEQLQFNFKSGYLIASDIKENN